MKAIYLLWHFFIVGESLTKVLHEFGSYNCLDIVGRPAVGRTRPCSHKRSIFFLLAFLDYWYWLSPFPSGHTSPSS